MAQGSATDSEPIDEVFTDALAIAEGNSQPTVSKRLESIINSREKLETCIDLMFTKVRQACLVCSSTIYNAMTYTFQALEETAKHSVLAQLCKVISRSAGNVEWTEEGVVKETTFKKELLSRCQAELDRVKDDDDEVFRLSEAVEDATTSEEKSQLESEHQEIMSRARKRALHLFSFFGELFTVQMLSENMMHECLVFLLKSTSDNEYLEYFCRLITNIGCSLDTSKSKVLPECWYRIAGNFRMVEIFVFFVSSACV